ncbi:restriction endonuclease subunit S [Vagococcus fluvialis]|uniref:restriction endonuclease subunit S n=1 Tax=Vagococcus fluvialis TaxID=2738 RepID=UPI001D0B475B|nr:restriction endonuclease subunit S [Vagococcus fluvialis]UDM79118.1 restriction endonuclease subunit S [Vagococcus fluvialis]
MNEVKIGWLFDVISSGSTPPTSQSIYYDNGTINWLNTGDLTDGLVTNIPKKITNEALLKFPTLKTYEPNSIVMAMYGATIAKLGIVMDYFTTNQACVVLSQPKESVYQKFIFYVLMSKRKDIINESRGGGQPNISQNIVKNIKLKLPKKHEQILIVSYIDSKLLELDNLISSEEKQIQLLEEQRQAMITEVVTKGLNSNVEMKDSGNEWIGEIPNDWEVKRLKNVCRVHTGGTPKSKEESFWNEELLWFTPEDIGKDRFDLIQSKRKISKQGSENSSAKIIDGPAVIMTTRAPVGNIGISFEKFTTNQGCKSLTLIDYGNIRYIYYLLSIQKKWLNSISTGTTFLELSTRNLKNIVLPVPPSKEQDEICEFLYIKNNIIDDIINKVRKQELKLKEYRQSLIHEAVTGKISIDEMEKYLKEVEDDGN